MSEDQEGLADDPAAAFEALRAEVAQVRAALDGRASAGPDYSPTLAAIAKSLAAIEAHPALRSTPEAFANQVRQASEALQQQGRRELASAVQRVDAAGAELERLAERQRTRGEQVRQVAIMTAVGAVAGVIVWVCFSGPVARALPVSWSVPERMAAATLRLNRWEAGARMMRSADPTSWNGLAAASRLWRDNADALDGCVRSATRTGKAERCTVTLKPPISSGQAPGRD
ncbi:MULTISPECIES: DUF6118 family protein [Caulobacteraceae]|uniref:DUF6118 family protein n=1 Tax=Caulobacteraceae TaxID=76892 RepID=UPI0007845F3E|nr:MULTISPECIES: DUF6118 family protein [Caulobacteraceae]MDZ4112928.1 DUF6118 family protein [Brevundimonas sp.]